MNIQQINQLKNTSLGLLEAKDQNNGTSFSTLFMEAVKNTDQLVKKSDEYSVKIASGDIENIHEATIAAQKADISFQLVMQIRNKVLDAYREITRMQI
ncbi:flagellar hook-basal body complex protein FliE [Alkaliphilus peptidifermentans]|uniref:Flagellar hook-basal body complex protein FliE n=1 Tax=Alkaliphilus peptidifermentans DSM 18978 TaxID=1120976 RepID=A0A1G5DIR1_9FIRM|nr:flagellar hook-basal body complex protein FliE [Alkaliphilus peptidifermentans]SCY14474.1 flagellar hook-basal body complex protein FliE [Alkaliphilus peptidifermentans DSM 18978]